MFLRDTIVSTCIKGQFQFLVLTLADTLSYLRFRSGPPAVFGGEDESTNFSAPRCSGTDPYDADGEYVCRRRTCGDLEILVPLWSVF